MLIGKGNLAPAIAGVAVLILSVTGYTLWQKGGEAESEFIITDESSPRNVPVPAHTSSPDPNRNTHEPAKPSYIIVHVAGCVKKPGVYRLTSGSRAVDALKMAGGADKRANTDAVNLASVLDDAEQVYIPSKEESTGPATSYAATTKNRGASKNNDGKRDSGRSQQTIQKFKDPSKQFVNINNATTEQLQQLTGIGPAMADRIIEYRKSIGKFQSPDQLMDVQGIGPKKFEKLKPFIRLR